MVSKQQEKHLEKYGKYISSDLFFGRGKYTNLYIFEILALEGKITAFDLAGKVFEKKKGHSPSYRKHQSFSGNIYKLVDKLTEREYITVLGTKQVKGTERDLIGLTVKGQEAAKIISLEARSHLKTVFKNYSEDSGAQVIHDLIDFGLSQNLVWILTTKPMRDMACSGLFNFDLIDNRTFWKMQRKTFTNTWRPVMDYFHSKAHLKKRPPTILRIAKKKDREALKRALNNPSFRRRLGDMIHEFREDMQVELDFLKNLENRLEN